MPFGIDQHEPFCFGPMMSSKSALETKPCQMEFHFVPIQLPLVPSTKANWIAKNEQYHLNGIDLQL